jgi:general secretion pathway protein E
MVINSVEQETSQMTIDDSRTDFEGTKIDSNVPLTADISVSPQQNPSLQNTTNSPPSLFVEIAALQNLAKELDLPFVLNLGEPDPPRTPLRGDFDRISGSWARQHNMIPVKMEGDRLLVATCDPLNIEATEQLALCYDCEIALVLTSPEELQRLINVIRTNLMSDRSRSFDTSDDNSSEGIAEYGEKNLKIDVTDAEDDDAPIIRYVNTIIFKASAERASDVHIEPYETKLNVRFRIDGVLYDVDSKGKSLQAAIISRIKVMSGLNIAEKRLPQDGRIGLKIAGRGVDIRVSTVPTQFGERVVMRLLDKSARVLDLEQLEFSAYHLTQIKRLIKKPNGIVLVTGPTGSGKTTTLYSCLSDINTPALNILTVEDPIEYQLDGIGQMQVNSKISFTFASGLRAILRQDPDVVMVGEIRDTETAEIAIQASLTGHLVFSTLHTNDSAGAITRLTDMSIEPFLISSSLMAVMAQRLVRLLCYSCRVEYALTAEECEELGISVEMGLHKPVYRAKQGGCPQCQSTGYTNRFGIHELLIVDEAVRTAILQRGDATTIRNAAVAGGFTSLRRDGAQKVLEGKTSVSEVLLATHQDIEL